MVNRKIEDHGLNGYKVIIDNDGEFELIGCEDKKVNLLVDWTGFHVYYLEDEKISIYKHDIAREFIFTDVEGDHIHYLDNDLNNTNLYNLYKCNYEEYRESQIQRSREYDLRKDERKSISPIEVKERELISHYKLRLPSGDKIELSNGITLEEKKEVVNQILSDWDSVIHENWENQKIKYFLDGLSNYLVWHKEEENIGKEDKTILSIWKIEEMVGRRKGTSIPFSSLTKSQREELGIGGEDNA